MRVIRTSCKSRSTTRLHAYAFPRLGSFDSIRTTTATVLDMRRELQSMACDWPHVDPRTRSPPATSCWERTQLCRSAYQERLGLARAASGTGDLQETHDYVATMTANMISERDREDVHELGTGPSGPLRRARDHTLTSPGEANRAEAAALAWANQVAVGQ